MPRRAHRVAHTSEARSSPRTIRSYVLLGTCAPSHDPTLARDETGRQAPYDHGQQDVLFALNPRVQCWTVVAIGNRYRDLSDDRPAIERCIDEVHGHAT